MAHKSGNLLRDISDTLYLRLFEADFIVLKSDSWITQNVQSAFWRFYRNEENGAILRMPDETEFALPGRRVAMVPAGVRFSCENDSEIRHFYIHFDVLGVPSFLIQAFFAQPILLTENVEFENRVQEFAQSLSQTQPLNLAGQCHAKSLLYEGFARALTESPQGQQRLGATEKRVAPVAPALAAMETRFAEPLRTSELAALCYLSPDHFTKTFRECMGRTPGEYLRNRRVLQAAQRLLFTEESLEIIAAECGFGDRNYMTRCFTQVVKIAPAAYRRGRHRL